MLAELVRRSAAFTPTTWNAETRTVDAVISTGADVERRDARGAYIERLDITGVDPASLVGIPVLDGHRQDGAESIVGVVVAARHEGPNLVATLKLSDAADVQSVVRKIEEHIIRGVSIGYAPATAPTESKDGAGRRVRTIKPTIREVSVVAIPADARAHIRSEEPMAAQLETQDTPTITRAEYGAGVRALAETAGLDRAWADAQLDSEVIDLDAVRAAAFEAMQTRTAPAGQIRAHVGVDHTDPAIILERQAEALAQRMGGPAASDAAGQYIGMGFADYARDALTRAGERVEGHSPEALIRRAMMTTSDFPLLMEQGGTRVLSSAYQAAESPLKAIAARREVQDLRDVTILKMGEGSQLEEVTESGEIKSGTFGEGAESYSISTFAKLYSLSRKVLINDQFGAFGEMMRKLGQLAAATEANVLYSKLTQASGAGPVMSDGVRLFHADHGNLEAEAFGLLGLAAGRQALRSQKGLDGVTPVGVTPKYLVVGPELETQAEQILATLAAAKVEDQNVFAGKLTLVIEPRIENDGWYLFGDQTNAPVLEIAYLASAPGPQIESREGWDVLGREFRVVHDLGVGAVDFRGVYHSTGA